MEPKTEICKHDRLDVNTAKCLDCGFDPFEEFDLETFDDETGDLGTWQ